MFHRDPNHAPDHLVAHIAGMLPRPIGPAGSPHPDEWRAYVRELADLWWSQAFYAGVAFAKSLEPAPPIIVTLSPDQLSEILPEMRPGER